VLRLWQEIQMGLGKFRVKYGGVPAGIAVDAWGVDFGLLDRRGRLVGNPTCYRDPRTNGVPAKVFAKVSEAEIFASTGVQTMQINTLFQLAAMAGDPRLESAETLLMIPDLFHYFLCGEKAVEYTEATTTQMCMPSVHDWARGMLRRLDIPERILGRIVQPGTVLGEVGGDVLGICGLAKGFPVIAVASHDTASAVAAIPGLDEGSAFISSGTWSLMGVELDAPVTSEQARELGFTNEGGCAGKTLLMRNITGLWILQECVRHWSREQDGRGCGWDEVIAAAKASREFGPVILPNAAEFGAPGNMLEAIRGFCRASEQRVPETMGEFARCCFESLSLAYWSALEGLRSLTGREIRTLRVVGGGCLNTFLCQMTADACGCAVVSGPAEASALGNVMVQAVAVGELESVAAGRASLGESLELELVTYEPRRRDGWDEARARYGRLELG
jgi:rhamnulokinase